MVESDPRFLQFREKRSRFYERFDALRLQIDAWLEKHEQAQPTLLEISMLEAWHGERVQLIEAFQQAEDDFIAYLLSLKRTDV